MKKGILLVNLGTPKSANPKDVREFLKRFLGDERVIKMPRLLWKAILHGIILNTRPKKSAAMYEKIQTEAGFPLLRYTEMQRDNVAKLFPDYIVEYGMSYSDPSIETSLDKLLDQGVDDLTIVPMYPQYSGTTVGSVFDSVMNYFLKTDKVVNLHFIRSYYDNEIYANYFAQKIKQALSKNAIDAIVISYHGIPLSYKKQGDGYDEECTKTTEAIMAKVDSNIPVYQTYQSKFGPGEWLTPATSEILKKLPSEGFKKVLILAPGFVVDCLETIEELESENKGYFLNAGGEEFYYLAPFNGDEDFAKVVKSLIA